MDNQDESARYGVFCDECGRVRFGTLLAHDWFGNPTAATYYAGYHDGEEHSDSKFQMSDVEELNNGSQRTPAKQPMDKKINLEHDEQADEFVVGYYTDGEMNNVGRGESVPRALQDLVEEIESEIANALAGNIKTDTPTKEEAYQQWETAVSESDWKYADELKDIDVTTEEGRMEMDNIVLDDERETPSKNLLRASHAIQKAHDDWWRA